MSIPFVTRPGFQNNVCCHGPFHDSTLWFLITIVTVQTSLAAAAVTYSLQKYENILAFIPVLWYSNSISHILAHL